MSATLARRALCALSLSALGCSAILGVEDWRSDAVDAGVAGQDGGSNPVTCEACGADACVCAPAPPQGWSGPIAMHLGAQPAACAAPFGEEVLSGGVGSPSGEAAVCQACACGPPTGVACPPSTSVMLYDKSLCTGQSKLVSAQLDDVCVGLPTFDAASFMADVTPTQGDCKPFGGAKAVIPPGWPNGGRLCALASAPGCAGGATCAPALGSPRSPCIHRGGDVACPAGPYGERTIVYEGISDTRGCSDCGCGAPRGESCTAIISFFSELACTTFVFQDASDDTCQSFTQAGVGGVKVAPGVVQSGTCLATGGDPMGVVEGAEPTTVCCM